MGKIREVNKNLWIKTKDVLPFEDNAFLEYVPIFVETHNAKTESDFKYLKRHKKDCDNEKLEFGEYIDIYYPNSDKQVKQRRINFDKLLYFVCDTSKGTMTPHYYCRREKLDNYIKRRYPHRKYISGLKDKEKNRKIYQRFLYTTNLIDNVLVFRFFTYCVSFGNRDGNAIGFYETHRICFRGMESWGENREELYHFDNRYMVFSNKIRGQYAKYECVDGVNVLNDIYNIYPMIFNETIYLKLFLYIYNMQFDPTAINVDGSLGELYKQNINIYVRKYKERYLGENTAYNICVNDKRWTDISLHSLFCTFSENFEKLDKCKSVFKNVPISIANDCKSRIDIPSKLKFDLIESAKSFYNKKEDETPLFGTYSLFQGDENLRKVVIEKEDDYIIVRYYACNVEMERLYITSDRIMKFVYNDWVGQFVSTKNEHMRMYGISNDNIYLKTTYKNGRSKFTKIDEKLYNEIKQGFIIERYNWIDKVNLFKSIDVQNHNLYMEQMLKLGFNHLYKDIIDQTSRFHSIMLNIQKTPYTIRTLYKANINEIFGIKGSNLKYLDKNMNIDDLQMFKEAMIDTFYDNQFNDNILRIKLCSLGKKNVLKRIIKEYKKGNKDYQLFFRNIYKGRSSKQVATLLQKYIDYWGFRPNAIKYGAFNYPIFLKPSEIEFMHNKACRDYLYYDDNHNPKYARRNKMFEKFVNSKEYLKFIPKEDDSPYTIVPAKVPADLSCEGIVLSHCVGAYITDMSQGRSYIYFVRMKEKKDIPFYTLEVCSYPTSLKENKYYLNQCYGYKDTTDKDDDLRIYIKKWCKENKITISCTV